MNTAFFQKIMLCSLFVMSVVAMDRVEDSQVLMPCYNTGQANTWLREINSRDDKQIKLSNYDSLASYVVVKKSYAEYLSQTRATVNDDQKLGSVNKI